MYVVDVRKNITVDRSSLEITNFIEMRVEATRSPAKPEANGNSWNYFKFVAKFGRSVISVETYFRQPLRLACISSETCWRIRKSSIVELEERTSNVRSLNCANRVHGDTQFGGKLPVQPIAVSETATKFTEYAVCAVNMCHATSHNATNTNVVNEMA